MGLGVMIKEVIDLLLPDWWDSIRALLAILLTGTFCYSILFRPEINPEKMLAIKELTLLTLTFYFVLKKRPEENGINK